MYDALSLPQYTEELVAICLSVFSLIILATEFSPLLLETYILRVFPWLDHYLGRGLFYLFLSLFGMGNEMGSFENVTAFMIALSGVANLFIYKYVKKQMDDLHTNNFTDSLRLQEFAGSANMDKQSASATMLGDRGSDSITSDDQFTYGNQA
mmetsp:Transcript_27235/g.31441  ORF Transcript_27235/g.31441 Transcript_27235/m.31441 type:complete len:152 (-) Transcript_27235:160-615(-)